MMIKENNHDDCDLFRQHDKESQELEKKITVMQNMMKK